MDVASFRAIWHKSLSAAGLGNDRVTVALEGDALILTGAAGARRALPVAEISRIRIGYARSRYQPTSYWLRIWRADAPDPLVLCAVRGDEQGFADGARALADAVWAAHGAGSVESGLTTATAMSPVLMMLGVAVAALLLFSLPGRHGHPNPHANDFLIADAVVLPLGAVLVWFVARSARPRPLSGPRELEAFLPVRPADV